jgi:APA family basic amino acid/polyamine antiporter
VLAPNSVPRLVRAIGRWSLAALVLNSIIGSGIFGLPSLIAGLVGWWAPVAYLVAALGMGAIMACFAEVASQFAEAGGPYLYARETFGRFAGIQVGWLAWLVRLTSAAANANIFVLYVGEFWKPAVDRIPRMIILTIFLGVPVIINIRGVSGGANLSNMFAIAKLLPIAVFVGAGLVFVAAHGLPVSTMPSTVPAAKWMEAILLLVFAFGGFEGGLLSAGEVHDPRRAVPFALFVSLAVTCVVYALVQIVTQAALPAAAMSPRPLADAARVFLGGWGARFISMGALVSIYGYLSSQMLNAPRLSFALAEGGDFPSFFAKVHPTFRTPWVSILIYALIAWCLAVGADFRWNATISAVGRMFTYAAVCGALPALRRWQPERPAFRVPFGWVFAGFGLAFCVALISRMGKSELIVTSTVMLLAFVNWLWARQRVQ